MLCRFSSLRILAANACKLAATRITTPPAFNLMLHTSTACKGTPKKPDETQGSSKKSNETEKVTEKEIGPPKVQERPSVAVLLAGCGQFDGSLPCEVVSLAIHLDRHNIKADYFAENHLIPEAINHLFADEFTIVPHDIRDPEVVRYSYDDARRIMNTDIQRMSRLKHYKNNRFYAGLFIPGGDGATHGVFTKYMRQVVQSFAKGKEKRPIGTISNGGYGTARVLKRVKITIGRTEETVGNFIENQWVESMMKYRANLQAAEVHDVIHCEKYNLYSTPGYLAPTGPHYYDIHLGIGKLVDAMKDDIERWKIDPFDDCN